MDTYIAKMGQVGGSGTYAVIDLPYSNGGHQRAALRLALNDGTIHSRHAKPGLWLMATPQGRLINAHLFMVSDTLDVTEFHPAEGGMAVSTTDVTRWPPRT